MSERLPSVGMVIALASRLPAVAALVCAGSVALAAYASHAATPILRERLWLASGFALLHAIGLLALSSRSSLLASIGKISMMAGIALFSGSLAAAALWSTPTGAAPLGGMLLIAGWLLMAADFLRRP